MALTRQPCSPADGGSGSEATLEDIDMDESTSPVSNITEETAFVARNGTSDVNVPETETQSDLPSPEIMSTRAYQREMLDQSLQGNVIVAMDTGSGKTQVAVLRIKAELEKGSLDKIIWFLAPTVSLCEQQWEVIRIQNPSVSVKLLTGENAVDSWSKKPWDDILSCTRVMVTPYQILLDALTHGFVTMEKLALLVVDEAHNCKRNSPISQVMTKFYSRAKAAGQPVPAILGLTASPIMRSRIKDMKDLEVVMDAHCVTPTMHRDELLRCVNRPELLHREYAPNEFPEYTAILESLGTAYKNMDIKADPKIRQLLADTSDKGRRELQQVIFSHDTYAQKQMKGFWGRSKEVLSQLGPWAVDRFITTAIRDMLQRVDSPSTDQTWPPDDSKRYLANCLRQIPLGPIPEAPTRQDLSEKATILIQELLSAEEKTVSIIFVKERATVDILINLLLTFPAVVEKYRIGTMVGTSKFAGGKTFYDVNHKTCLTSLQDFRSGKINLLVATSVLEEGIDVPACNLVICFEKPPNLKSFIQRRGRARMKRSKLLIIHEHSPKGPFEWEALEDEMKREYQKERSELARLETLEEEATGLLFYEVPSTGARLDLDNAKPHLEHFCSVASRGEYVDCRPDYVIHPMPGHDDLLNTATVLLPSFLEPQLRQWKSGSAWASQKNAIRDAAFHAYLGLYKAGLVNDNLLPIRNNEIEEEEPMTVNIPSFSPWKRVAQAWKETGERWLYSLEFVDEDGNTLGQYNVVLPVQVPEPRPIHLHPRRDIIWKINIGQGTSVSYDEARELPDHISALLVTHFGHRWEVKDVDHVVQLFSRNEDISRDQVGADAFDPLKHDTKMPYFVRDQTHMDRPFEYVGLQPSKPPIEEVHKTYYDYTAAPANVPYLIVKKITKRADHLHRIINAQPNAPESRRHRTVLPMPWVTVDRVPKRIAQFAMLIPAVIHELEVLVTAVQLQDDVLQPIGITDIQLVIEAISSRHAAEPVNLERLEFLGDSILKFCTVIQVSAQYLTWPEGFLSFAKDKKVSNLNLLQACVRADVPKFILTKSFTAHKWRPIYVEGVLGEKPPAQKPLPSKMLADVVEALIGASYVDGGMPKALKCISLFLTGKEDHKTTWYGEREGWKRLFDHAIGDTELPSTLRPLEEFIGYSFRKKGLLVEAMTHASCTAEGRWRSFERLEFLGDAILDYIVVTKTFNRRPPLPHSKMHLLKTTVVNADFLGFIALGQGPTTREAFVDGNGNVEEKEVTLPLWKFMRHAAPAIGVEQMETEKRFEKSRAGIEEMLAHGTHHPWVLLAQLQPKKFYSDLVESLIGAVWVDSGSIDVCEGLLRRLSILNYVERLMEGNVHFLHPKEELGLLAVSEKVVYHHEVLESADGEREHRCKVIVGGREVGYAKGALGKEEAKTRAAEAAVRFLKAGMMG